jgi:hypothetical protein
MMRFSPSTLGWYPDFITYIDPPNDLVEVSDDLYGTLLGKAIEAGPDGMPREVVAPPTPAPDPVEVLTLALQAELDVGARALGYDDIKTAITYRGDPNPKFAAEAEGLFQWRSAVWTQAYALLSDVQSGAAQFPTIDEALAMMPALVIDAPP